MNREITELREVILKLVPMLTGRGLKVTMRGSQAFVRSNPHTRKPELVNIPSVPDTADPAFIRAISGFIDHEVGHVLHTNFDYYGGEFLTPAQIQTSEVQHFASIHNIVEDPYVERMQMKLFPGAARNLKDLHQFFLERITKKALHAAKTDKERFSYLIVPIIRALSGQGTFEQFLKDEGYWTHRFVQDLWVGFSDEAKKLMLKSETTKETLIVARELAELLKPKPQPQPEPQPEEEDQSDDQEPGEGSESKDGESQDKPDQKAGEGDGDGERDHSESEGEEGTEESSDGAGEKPEDADGDKDGDAEQAADEEKAEEGDTDADTTGDADNEAGDGSGEDDGEADGEPGDDGDNADGDDEGDGANDEGAGDGESDGDDDQGENGGSVSDNTEDDDQDAKGESADDAGEGLGSSGDDAADSDQESGEGSDGDNAKGEGSKADVSGDVPDENEGDNEGGGGVGASLEAVSIFDVKEGDLKDMDLSGAIAVLIQEEVLKALEDAGYSTFSRDYDRIEPAVVDPMFDQKHVVKMDEDVRSMTGRMQKDIERMMASQSHVHYIAGQRKGKLHAPSLFRVSQGDDRVFAQKEQRISKSTAVTLLVDNSGSMRGEKMRLAMVAAYALSSTLERVKIANEVIGFTTGSDYNEINAIYEQAQKDPGEYERYEPIMMPVYKSFDEGVTPLVKRRIAYAAAAQQGMSGNVDGESLQYAAQRIARRREDRKVIIVLSDGQPSGGMTYGAHLKRVIKDIEKAKIDCIGIGIMDASVKNYYPRCTVLHRAADLPGKVMQELKALLT